MRAVHTELEGVLILEPEVFGDERGWLFASYHHGQFTEATGRVAHFVQDLQSLSTRGVVRGIHYQLPPRAQAKIVSVLAGEVFDVIVDLRRSSPSFGRWCSVNLSAENKRQVWIPEGFGHGFCVLSEEARMHYKTTDFYSPADQRTVLWNDPAIGIDWPVTEPLLSAKDRVGAPLREAGVFA